MKARRRVRPAERSDGPQAALSAAATLSAADSAQGCGPADGGGRAGRNRRAVEQDLLLLLVGAV